MGEIRNTYNILVGKLEGKGLLREIMWDGVDWMHLAQVSYKWRSLVKTIMNLQVPQKGVWGFIDYLSDC
jgi:hypothetical protein